MKSFSSFQSWDAYFRSNTYCAPPSFAPQQKNHVPLSSLAPMLGGGALAGAEPDEKIIDDHLAVQAIIRSYQVTRAFRTSFLYMLHASAQLNDFLSDPHSNAPRIFSLSVIFPIQFIRSWRSKHSQCQRNFHLQPKLDHTFLVYCVQIRFQSNTSRQFQCTISISRV